MPTLVASDIDAVCRLSNELCGIQLDSSKDYLIESRLTPMLATTGSKNFVELVSKIRGSRELTAQFVNSITTNETLFFRDQAFFQALQHKALPELIDARYGTRNSKRIRIWSAACSSGQECYSIAIALTELIPDIHSWDINILGSDISSNMVSKASLGSYSTMEVERGMPPEKLNRYFQRDTDQRWKVRDEIRALCRFEQRNLLKSMADVSTFDIIFCRNVAIYFSMEDRRNLFDNLAKHLAQDGYMFVGSSESLADLGKRFAPQHHCRSVFYRPNLLG